MRALRPYARAYATATYNHLPGGILFTPGPLTTTATVKEAMNVDWGSRDGKFVSAVKAMREKMLQVGGVHSPDSGYTLIPMQGSGSMGIEAILGSAVPPNGKVLIIKNGAYGARMKSICQRLGIAAVYLESPENETPDLHAVEQAMAANPDISTVAVVHCETTTGILNPIAEISALKQKILPNATYFVDAMSSFGGVPVDVAALNIDYLCTSSNKCVQGVPGFSLIIARVARLQETKGWARSYCLDLLMQWEGLEKSGQFNNTPPIQSIMAFKQALDELDAEGWVEGRCKRYQANAKVITEGLKELGFQPYLKEDAAFGWIILTFIAPADPKWDFQKFYTMLNDQGYVIYPGKLTDRECFRIGCIGDIHPSDAQNLVDCIRGTVETMGLRLK